MASRFQSRVLSIALYALGASLLFSPTKSHALDLIPDGVTASYGEYAGNKADLSNTRLSLRWNWNKNLIENDSLTLSGYFDLGYSRWRSHLSAKDQPSPNAADKIWAVGFSPVFRLAPQSSAMVVPFLDAGVGVSYQSEKDIEKKLKSPINMGGHTQFEIRAGAGIMFGESKQYELAYHWFHYSNANIHSQNEGLDFHMLSLSMQW